MRKYCLKEKEHAVRETLERQRSAQKVAGEVGTSTSVVKQWLSVYERFGSDGLKPKQQNPHYPGDFKQSVVESILLARSSHVRSDRWANRQKLA